MDRPPRPLPRRSRRPLPRRRRPVDAPRRRSPSRPGSRGDDWSLEGLVAGLRARVEAHADAHPGEPPAGWLYRVIDAWAAERDVAWRARPAASGLPIVPEPACREGCVHCCYQHVAVTGAEAMILAEHVRGRWSAAEMEEWRVRVEREADRFRRIEAEARSPGEHREALARVRRPCPMLDERAGRCRAYDARPVNCRRENSIDVEVCRRYREDPGATDSSLRLVRYDVIWGAVRAFLARWGAEHLGLDAMAPLEVALASALGGPAGGDSPAAEDCRVAPESGWTRGGGRAAIG